MHETEKSLSEHKDKLSEADVKAIEEARDALKKSAEGEDKAGHREGVAGVPDQGAEARRGALQGGPGPAGRRGWNAPAAAAERRGESEKDGDEPVDADFEVKA